MVFTLVTDTTLWLGHSLASLRNSCSIIGEQQTRALQFRDEALPSAWFHFSSGLKWDLVEVRPVGRGGSNAVSSPGSTKKAGLTSNICMGQPGGIQLMPGCQDSALGLLSLQHFYWSTGREQEYMQWVVTVEMTLSGIAEFAAHSGTNISMPHFFLVCTLPPLLWVICGCAMECPSLAWTTIPTSTLTHRRASGFWVDLVFPSVEPQPQIWLATIGHRASKTICQILIDFISRGLSLIWCF